MYQKNISRLFTKAKFTKSKGTHLIFKSLPLKLLLRDVQNIKLTN